MSLNMAILGLLRSVVEPVYDADVPTDRDGAPLAQRYAVLYPDPGNRAAEDLTRTRADTFTHRWQVTSVGSSREQAEWVAIRCRDALLDTPIEVVGWELGAVEHPSSSPIRPDPDIPGRTLFVAVDTYTLTATR